MKKTNYFFVLMLLCIYISAFGQSTYYATPNGSSSNDGSSFNSPMDLFTALNAAGAGDEIILSGETFYIPYTEGKANTIELSKSGSSGSYITLRAADNSIATLDFSFPDMAWVQDSYGLYVTGSYWYFKGLKITHAGYQGAYITGGYNTFENCIFYDNRNTGFEINKGGHHTTVINCDAYYNYDPKKGGSMADGFGPKQTQGAGNQFIGCRAWLNSDDGFDCFDSPEVVTFKDCWAFKNGIDVWQFDGALEFGGNGNGFKVGGNYELANNVLTNCVAFGHPNKGFDQNNNTGGLTIYNCTGFNNGTNYGLGNDLASGQNHILRNNISLDGAITISNAIQSNNTWNSGFSVSSGDFISLDLNQATVSRNSDGSLPQIDLFRLNSSSSLINAGIDVGLPYSGSAPDLGAFEYEEQNSDDTEITIQENSTGFCSVDGSIDNNNSGFTGSGFANTDNALGEGIDYKVYVGEAGTYTIKIRYAATSDRPAALLQNGVKVLSNISLPSTGSWTTWYTVSVQASLSSGLSDLRLEATGSSGLPNIDYLAISGEDIQTADCNATTPVFYTLSANIIGSGTVLGAGSYEQGAIATLTATPSSGYVFSSWSGDATGTSETLSIVMDSDKNVTANFVEQSEGTITLTASAGNGSVFLNWSASNIENSFEIYRDIDSDPSGRMRIQTVANSVNSYTDASVTNGTTYFYWIKSLDVSGNEVNSNSASATPYESTISVITIQENETGFCNVEGLVENEHTGYTGSGYANTSNEVGSGIEWAITFSASEAYDFSFRYASTSDRPAKLIIDGTTVVSNINFPSTGSWTSWTTLSTVANVAAGSYIARLEATGADGLANIDYMEITGTGADKYECSTLKAKSQLLTFSDNESMDNFNFFPNPSNGLINIEFILNKPAELTVDLYDFTGKYIASVVKSQKFEKGKNMIHYQNCGLKAGIYFLSIQTESWIKSQRLIIE